MTGTPATPSHRLRLLPLFLGYSERVQRDHSVKCYALHRDVDQPADYDRGAGILRPLVFASGSEE